ncbi:hypothetical protein [Pseudoroseicyclus aestuarii]|uniref:Uncharacterized protein n=1 Tax=Pseudoroseicyclus aestuarii TaxID=1795041 RepID=A0A318STK6_9RHOB|nr:hypothetical protein [Pseudoroseicyclus aestuarii]PYE82190.1 hypothetical protein DFP88_10530 [Pseudoroseicyclus aestuarii]
MRKLILTAVIAALPAVSATAQASRCASADDCARQAGSALERALQLGPDAGQELAALRDRVSRLERLLEQERQAVQFTVTRGDTCPEGWVSYGRIGWLWDSSDRNANFARGGAFNDGWDWVHPRLCGRR